MAIILPELPYAYDALEPYTMKETMHLHHDKRNETCKQCECSSWNILKLEKTLKAC